MKFPIAAAWIPFIQVMHTATYRIGRYGPQCVETIETTTIPYWLSVTSILYEISMPAMSINLMPNSWIMAIAVLRCGGSSVYDRSTFSHPCNIHLWQIILHRNNAFHLAETMLQHFLEMSQIDLGHDLNLIICIGVVWTPRCSIPGVLNIQ